MSHRFEVRSVTYDIPRHVVNAVFAMSTLRNLDGAQTQKVNAIKVMRQICVGLGLLEAKLICEYIWTYGINRDGTVDIGMTAPTASYLGTMGF